MSTKSTTILVIEDNEAVRENIAETLELSSYQVLTAEDGNVGVKLAKAHQPNLILCDVMMPQLDGFGVLRILSKQPETASIPFIFLTARGEKADFRRGMELGADDYITKPFGKDELLLAIDTRLSKFERISQESQAADQSNNRLFDLEKGRQILESVFEQGEKFILNKKDILFEEGQKARYLYQILKGRVKLSRYSELGKSLILDLRGPIHRSLEPNPFMGYRAILHDEGEGCTALALDDEVILRRIPTRVFEEQLRSDRHVSAYFSHLISNDLTHTKVRMLSLAYQSVRKRTAEALLWLNDTTENLDIGNTVAREDLAQIVGTATESVIRMLREFKDDGYISQEKGRLIVLDQEGLSELPA
ncbi:MAG: response regulator [Bacteroidota bacterium]